MTTGFRILLGQGRPGGQGQAPRAAIIQAIEKFGNLELIVFALVTVTAIAAGGECVFFILAGRWDSATLAGLCFLVDLNAAGLILLRR